MDIEIDTTALELLPAAVVWNITFLLINARVQRTV